MSNNCVERDLSFTQGFYFSNHCNLVSNSGAYYTTTDYLNLSNFSFNVRSGFQSGHRIAVCKYDLSKNFVSYTSYTTNDFSVGSHSINLDPNYLYRFSYPGQSFNNLKAYQCNVGIGSMANELAFGKLTFLDQIGTIIPFVISLIAFALGFLLLKKMIKRGNQGHA